MSLIIPLLACIIGLTASVKGQNDIEIEVKSEQLEIFLSSFFNGSRVHELLTLSSAVSVNFKDYNTYSSDFYHDLAESAVRAVPSKDLIKRIMNEVSILTELSRKLRKSIDEKDTRQWSLLLPSIHDTLLNLRHLLGQVDQVDVDKTWTQLLHEIDVGSPHGGHECQISEGGTEADLHKHLKTCQKNPGHRQFIPIKSFNKQHLPEDHRDTDLYDLINAVAELTVRVSVMMVSPHRPEFILNTNSPYPFYGMGGDANTRSGSGVITIYKYECGCGHNVQGKRQNPVTERIYEREYKSCPCEQCQHSDKPSNVWWEIYVGTAAHVVFDEIEARHTTCRLFYDERTSPLVCLDKFTLDYVDVERDRCRLMSVVCDSSLGDRLFQTAVHRDTLQQKLDAKYKNRDNGTLSFIVSHPHGCPKQVSIGQYKENYIVGDYNQEYKFTKLSYTTSTCPGSSGASVCCLGLNNLHVHGGSLDKALNHSTIDWSTVSEQCS